ncbi:MAG: DUF5050 domain-containing protein [Thermoleophilaceae bacterium]
MLIASLAITARADAIGTIARANLDGSAVQRSFIAFSLGGSPCSLAIDASHIYWSESYGRIGRANLDGSAVDASLVRGTGECPAVAVDASHIYWTRRDNPVGIGRANLDGSSPNQTFIDLNFLENPCGIAVDSSHIYWSGASPANSITRANLDGSSPTVIVSEVASPCAMAIDASHIYWAGNSGIDRANLDGTSPEILIPGVGTVFLGYGLTVDNSHIYWTDANKKSIGSANIDGSAPNPGFITGIVGGSVAVDGSHIYWGDWVAPRYAATVDIGRDRGKVRLEVARTRGFVSLNAAEQIPVGSIIDTTRGRAQVSSASKSSTETYPPLQNADVYGGVVKVRQPKGGKPTTELDLVDSSGSGGRNGVWTSGIWGGGTYRITGKHGSATVRPKRLPGSSPIWFTEDRPGGTFFKVKRGTVAVEDFTSHRQVTLKKGEHYLAPAHR